MNLQHLLYALSKQRPQFEGKLGEFVIDSRQVTLDDVFVALSGEHIDGHLYVADAFKRGAAAAIVEKPVAGYPHLDLRDPNVARITGIRHDERFYSRHRWDFLPANHLVRLSLR